MSLRTGSGTWNFAARAKKRRPKVDDLPFGRLGIQFLERLDLLRPEGRDRLAGQDVAEGMRRYSSVLTGWRRWIGGTRSQ